MIPGRVALSIGLALVAVDSHAQVYTGPQSSQSPYIVPTVPGWEVTALISVGDSARDAPYRLVGLPDGMGAIPGRFAGNGDYIPDRAAMTVFLNHELGATSGIVRAHGQSGAFVSQWTIHIDSRQVTRGEDLIQRVMTWDGGAFSDTTGGTRFNRFCSADLPARTAFFNPASGKGFDGRLFMTGEEAGTEGRAFATVLTGEGKGTAYQLPHLGRFAWENALAHPDAGDKTWVMGLDDSSPGQLYLYVGDKQHHGNPVEKAGLHGGRLYGIRVIAGGENDANAPVRLENAGAINGRFELVDLSRYAAGSGAMLQLQSAAVGVTEFARPEDGHWDSRNPNVFYWVTSGRAPLLGAPQSARLYRLIFNGIGKPAGGRIEMVLDSASLTGTDGRRARDFDNMTVDGDGNILIQEDPGDSAYLAKIWRVDPVGRKAEQIFESDRERFLKGGSAFLTESEEHSGIIEITDIVKGARWYQPGRRYYLGTTQAHYGLPGELVQGGQIYLMASPKPAPAGKNARP